ncbi:MAG: hypothetical protein WD000_01620 [Thermodesulfobacteriota bacterium]
MFNFIHKRAVENYKSELRRLIDTYASIEKDELADYFVFSVWTRAGLQNEGHIQLPDGTQNLSSDLDYSMLSPLSSVVSTFNRRGNLIEAAALSIWVHSARGTVNTEMSNDLKELWELIMGTQNYWDTHLKKIYNEDQQSGMDKTLLEATFNLSKRILENVPPKPFRQNNPEVTFQQDKSESDGAEELKVRKVVETFLNPGVSENPPQFVIVMGGVGAGKTTTRKQQYAEGYVHFEFGEIYIAVRNILGGNNPKRKKYAVLASDLILKESIREKKNIVIEIIGDNYDIIEPITDKMHGIGYEISMQQVTADVAEAYNRHLEAVEKDESYISAYFTQEATLAAFYDQLKLGDMPMSN